MSLWIGVTKPSVGVQGGLAHAVDFPAYKPHSKRRTVETACGLKRAQLIGIPVVDSEGVKQGAMAYYWPPFVADMKEAGFTRCPECMRLRPGKASRPEGSVTGFGYRSPAVGLPEDKGEVA
jgi:hypothetical protein